MLSNIRSIYIVEIIFSYIEEKSKLKIIRHNKDFQKKMGIELIHYKLLSGRFIKYEKDKIAKEYRILNNNIIYEGEYLNGKRHGKGKEFYETGELRYEGEYLNGKRKGKGKEFYIIGSLLFEGEYSNGNRWNGKGYDPKNNLIYEIKDGNGKVKE